MDGNDRAVHGSTKGQPCHKIAGAEITAMGAARNSVGCKNMPHCKHPITMITVAGMLPLSYFVFPFLCGFCGLSQGYLILLVPMMLLTPFAAGIVIGTFLPGLDKRSRVGIGLAVWFLSFALFFVFPAGAKTWTLGFSANFMMTKHPRQVQQWAISILERYEAGQLATSTNAPYWAVVKTELNASEVPSHIRELWRDKPSIGIAEVTPDGGIKAPSHNRTGERNENLCVALSWYLTGLLVGRPDFRSAWNPWFIFEITPGVYAYCGMK